MPKQRRIKGVKGQPGVPTTEYGELKKPVQVTLTPTAIAQGTSAANTLGISRSELIERMLRTLQIMNDLQKQYHLTIKTPFDIGEPYFAGATQLGSTGWNGKPDYETHGATMDDAIHNLAKMISTTPL